MFSENFKRLRLRSGLSQKNVAELLGLSHQSVSNWEKGETLPSIEYLPTLSELFTCNINEFFTSEEKPQENP